MKLIGVSTAKPFCFFFVYPLHQMSEEGNNDSAPSPVSTSTDGNTMSDDFESKSDLLSPDKEYAVFRKEFHLPSQWKKSVEFKKLIEKKYITSNLNDTFQFIESTLKNLGYGDDNQTMLHDYLHYMLEDMLMEKNIPFVTEEKIKSEYKSIQSFLGGNTPDLIVEGKYIIDVYTGTGEPGSVKGKYRDYQCIFKVLVVTPHNFTSELARAEKLFTTSDISYLNNTFHIFRSEYQYWMSCLKLKKILRNDVQNIKMKQFKQHEEFPLAQQGFADRLQAYLDTVKNTKI